jgi:hypothetical protein
VKLQDLSEAVKVKVRCSELRQVESLLLFLLSHFLADSCVLINSLILQSRNSEDTEKWKILDPRTRAGKGDGTGTLLPSKEDSMVPLSCWTSHKTFYAELLHRFCPKSVIDLTPMDYPSAVAAAESGINWTGVAQTSQHAELLRARIAAGLLHSMVQPESPLHKPDLANVHADLSGEVSPSNSPPPPTVLKTPIKGKSHILESMCQSRAELSQKKALRAKRLLKERKSTSTTPTKRVRKRPT